MLRSGHEREKAIGSCSMKLADCKLNLHKLIQGEEKRKQSR